MNQTQELLQSRLDTAWEVYGSSRDEKLQDALLIRIADLKERLDTLAKWALAPASV